MRLLSIALKFSPVLLLALLAALPGPGPARASHGSTPGQVDYMRIDTDTTGNSCTSGTGIGGANVCTAGPNDPVIGGVPLLGTFQVDVIADQSDPADQIAGAELHISYCDGGQTLLVTGGCSAPPTILKVTAVAYGGPPITFNVPDATMKDLLPDTNGVFNFADASITPPLFLGYGTGSLGRITFQCIGTGHSALGYDDSFTLNTVVFANLTQHAPALGKVGADVYCNMPAPPPADVQVSSGTTAAPANAAVNTPFDVTAAGTVVQNLGPTSPVSTTVTESLSLPGDCTAPGGSQATFQVPALDIAVPFSVPQQTFSVVCASASQHTFTTTVSAGANNFSYLDPNPSNNSQASSAVTAVTASADFSVPAIGVGGPASGTAGVPFDVSVNATLNNAGPDAAPADATVTLSLPPDCTATGSNPKTVLGILVPVGSTAMPAQTFSVTCTSKSDHIFSATVSLAAPLHVTELNTANNSASGASPAVAVVAPADVKVSGVALGAPATAPVGTAFDVTAAVTVEDDGPFGPVNADIATTVAVPAGCATASTNPQLDASVSLPVSPPAAATALPVKTWSVTCTTVSSLQFTATAQISLTPGQIHISDPNGANNSTTGSATVQVLGVTDLSVTKMASPDPAHVGSPLVYTITANNNGPAAAPGVVVTDALPGGVTFGSATASQGSCSQTMGTVSCGLGNLANGSTATISITVTPSAPGSISNTAAISGSVFDTNPANDTSTVTTTVNPGADLSLTKSGAPNSLYADFGLAYTVTVTNNGPSGATGVTITDQLPGGVTFGSAIPTQGTCGQASGTVTCNVGSLANGGSATVTMVVTPMVAGTITNTASVAGNEFDSNPWNNTAAATTMVYPAADLSIIKTALPNPTNFGGTLTYTLTVTNNGPSPATGVTTTDYLPGGVAFFSAVASQGSCVQAAGIVCDLGTLANGASATATITTTPTVVGTVSNTGSVAGHEFDPNPGNNQWTVLTTTVTSSNLDLTGLWSGEFDNAALGGCTSSIAQTGSGIATLSGSVFCTAASGGSLTGNFNTSSREFNASIAFKQPVFTVTISNARLSQDHTTLFGTWTCSCGSGAFFMSKSQPLTTAAVTASAGGVLLTATADTLTVPAGALASDTTLTSTLEPAPAPAPPGLAAISRAYQFGPDGTVFSTPVTAVFNYTAADLAGLVDPTSLRVWVYDSQSHTWQLLGGVVDTVAQTITISLTHFSQYGLFGTMPSALDSDNDAVTNSVDNCPSWPNPLQNLPSWPVPANDPDCDGFSAAAETFLGTNPNLACGVNAWPADMTNDGKVSLVDVLAYAPVWGTQQGVPPPPGRSPYDQRFDLNMDTRVSLADVLAFAPFFGKMCTP